jgi:type I restriction enzyme S subunit
MPLNHGISQFPYALEAVYPAGPLAITINRATGKATDSYISNRTSITNANGQPVPTTVFLEQKNAGVSAVIAYSRDRSKDVLLPLDVVHNHFASAPLPNKILGPEVEEWGTESDGKDGINVKRLVPPVAETES